MCPILSHVVAKRKPLMCEYYQPKLKPLTQDHGTELKTRKC